MNLPNLNLDKRAVKIRDLPDWRGAATIYEVSPALDVHTCGYHVVTDYVIASAVILPDGVEETMVFASDKDGGKLPGIGLLDLSYVRGRLSHAEALKHLEYRIVDQQIG